MSTPTRKTVAAHAAASLPTAAAEPPQGSRSVGAWFLGPKAENADLILRFVQKGIQSHIDDRRGTFPEDPAWIDDTVRGSADYQDAVRELEEHHNWLLERLRESVPFFSYRYQAHMLYDVTLPSVVGYVSSLLYNQNNVAGEASPVTTVLEMKVGEEICEMLGFFVPPESDKTTVRPWGHITCDGSVANIEALWAARNLKLFVPALATALAGSKYLQDAKGIDIPLPAGGRKPIVDLSPWEKMNLGADDVLALPQRLQTEYGVDATTLDSVVAQYSVQGVGMAAMLAPMMGAGLKPPVVIVPATAHYSWPKAAAILGIGQNQLLRAPVDEDARLDPIALRALLERCLADQTPVLAVVAVIGSTEESAVDPLAAILEARDAMRALGMDFTVHADAAWGGYFNALRIPHITWRDPCAHLGGTLPAAAPSTPRSGGSAKDVRHFAPDMVMSTYVDAQYAMLGKVDSITVDPHKAGMIPYPAGSLCYRNSAMRGLVSLQAPVVYHGGIDPTVGIYGVEGSKPGAAAAAVWLSHAVIRPDQSGYGRILGRCLYGSKRLYASLITMAEPDDEFVVVPLQRLPAERAGESPERVQEQVEFIRSRVADRDTDELFADPEAKALFRELGSDQIILTYAFNFYVSPGVLNTSAVLANALNAEIFDALSAGPDRNDPHDVPMFVTSSDFDPATYGEGFMRTYRSRLGLVGEDGTPITFLISTTLDPFVTDTVAGNFIPTLIEKVRPIVRRAVQKVKTTPQVAS